MEWAWLMIGAWFAATISGAAGFGGALLLLPVLTHTVGAKAAVPVLTLAQLFGNLSRAGFGWKEICWKPALLFCLGAVPVSVLGARLFVVLPGLWIQRGIGVFLILVVLWRHSRFNQKPISECWLAPAGGVVGLLSALVGSAGPLSAVVFLGLQLPRAAYVASEAVTATAMHLTKTAVYGRYALLTPTAALLGLFLGVAMILGSWTGKKLIDRLDEKRFALLVEGLLLVSALFLLAGR